MIFKNIFNYKLLGNVGGLLLYRFVVEFDLKCLEEENMVVVDLNLFCEVLEIVLLGVVKIICCICVWDVVFFDCWFVIDWLFFFFCLEVWDFWNFLK